jgi:cbb3-type cytochrome oxidase maturation protein
MDILFLLVPLSVLLGLAVIGVLAWAIWSGQFEELESESERILMLEPATPVDSVDASLIHINTPIGTPLHTHTSLQQKRINS